MSIGEAICWILLGALLQHMWTRQVPLLLRLARHVRETWRDGR